MTPALFTPGRARRTTAVLVVTLVLGMALFLGLGHVVGHAVEHDAAMGMAGICLVLFTILVPLALAVAAIPNGPIAAAISERSQTLAPPSPPDPRARASPAWLERFLN